MRLPLHADMVPVLRRLGRRSRPPLGRSFSEPATSLTETEALDEDPEGSSAKQWNIAAMETYMLERAEEHVALGLLTPEDVVTMRQQQHHRKADSENGTESAEEESSPSWASSSASNTPSYASSGLAFDFGQKCTISADNLLNENRTTRRPINGRRSSILRLCGSLSSDQLAGVDGDSGPESPGDWTYNQKHSRKGSADDVPQKEYSSVPSGQGKLSRLLRRTQSAGCSKDVPAHALFLREKRVSCFSCFNYNYWINQGMSSNV